MSETARTPNPHEARIAAAASDLFSLLHGRLKAGAFAPANETEPALYITEIPEISSLCFATTEADSIDDPTTIEVYAHRISSPVAVTYWISATTVESQHTNFDENHDPFPINARQTVNVEELVDIHSKFFNSAAQ